MVFVVWTQFFTLWRSDELPSLQSKQPAAQNDGGRLRNGAGSNHGLSGICEGETRGGQTPTSWERPWTWGEWAWSWMQPDTALGLDRDEGRHLAVSATRLAHGSGAGRPGPTAAVGSARHTDRIADRSGRPERQPPRNDHAATLQGRGHDVVRSEARVVHHPRCRRPGGGEPPGRELLQETAERRRRRAPRDPSRRRDVSVRVRHRRL